LSKRYLNFEAECDFCEKVTWFREDLNQKPRFVKTEMFGGYDLVLAECCECGFGVEYFGTNAD